jgi:hypothetical protein
MLLVSNDDAIDRVELLEIQAPSVVPAIPTRPAICCEDLLT